MRMRSGGHLFLSSYTSIDGLGFPSTDLSPTSFWSGLCKTYSMLLNSDVTRTWKVAATATQHYVGGHVERGELQVGCMMRYKVSSHRNKTRKVKIHCNLQVTM